MASVADSMLDRNLTVISVVRLESGSNKTTPRGKLSDIGCHAIRRSGIRSTICTTVLYALPSSREVNEKWASSIFCTSRRDVQNRGSSSKPGPLAEQSAESYAATFDTNVLGTLLSIKHELRVMLAQGHGSIINVSSTYGRMGAPGASVYVASKHAVEGLTKAAALEAAGSGVRVNVIAPGPIETGMLNRFTGTDERKAGLVAGVPLKRVGRPEEIAQTIVFVASDKASYITGASIPVDGGKLAQ